MLEICLSIPYTPMIQDKTTTIANFSKHYNNTQQFSLKPFCSVWFKKERQKLRYIKKWWNTYPSRGKTIQWYYMDALVQRCYTPTTPNKNYIAHNTRQHKPYSLPYFTMVLPLLSPSNCNDRVWNPDPYPTSTPIPLVNSPTPSYSNVLVKEDLHATTTCVLTCP